MCSHFKWSVGNGPLAQALDGNDLKEIIFNDSLDMLSEEEKCQAIIDWREHRGASTNLDEFRQLMESIDWTLISQQTVLALIIGESALDFRYLVLYFFLKP